MIIQCQKCNKDINRKPSHVRKQNFCSRKCLASGYIYTQEQRDNLSAKGKLLKGLKRSPEACRNIALAKMGDKNPHWKGDDVGYTSLHEWINNNWGKLRKCEVCDTEDAKKFEWANLNGIYNRDRVNWKRMCCSCHCKYDNKIMNIKKMRK